MQIIPYLMFNGNCEEAFKFYEKCLGAKIDNMMTYEGSPAAEHVPPEMGKKVIHARLLVDGAVLMGSDVAPKDYEKAKGISVTLQIPDPAQAERVFHALAENGQVTMPIQQTFWAVRFGMLVDRFGIPWMVNCEQRA